jgi:nitrile hydratase subunit alpha
MSNSAHHPAAMPPVEQRDAALEALLTERGLVPEGFIEQITRRYESEIGPVNGVKVVARAWADPEYKMRLLADGTAAIAELGFGGPEGDHMVVVENTAAVHNVIVCTLCSCYPWPVLGLPPAWYKDPPYRADGPRAPGPASRDGLPAARGGGDPGLGLLRRGPLPLLTPAPARGRGHDRG